VAPPARRSVAGSRSRRPERAADEPTPAAEAPALPPVASQLLVVGRIGKPQGIRGEVTVEVRTDEPEARFSAGAELLTDPAERGPLTVEAARDQNGRLMVAFQGVPDRNAAEALRGTLLLVDAATLPLPDDPDVFLDVQLQGLVAELVDGTRVGTVSEVLHLPQGDVLAVKRDDGPHEVLVPFVAAMVPTVDVTGGRVVLDPPEGLLDLTDPTAPDEPAPDEPAPDEPAPDEP
jgi:16S rRNA processing protein RimM